MYNTADYMEGPEMTEQEYDAMHREIMNEIYGWWDDEEEEEEEE